MSSGKNLSHISPPIAARLLSATLENCVIAAGCRPMQFDCISSAYRAKITLAFGRAPPTGPTPGARKPLQLVSGWQASYGWSGSSGVPAAELQF